MQRQIGNCFKDGEISTFTDEGYYTATEKEKTKSKGKRRAAEDTKENGKRSNEKRENIEEAEKQRGPIRGAETPFLLPVMVALPCRRSTPLEDYVATMAGVGNLLQQQGELINKMRELLKDKQGEEEEEVISDQKKEEKGESSSSSSIQTLRRILEVEELMRFSMMIDEKLQGIEEHLESSNKPNSIK